MSLQSICLAAYECNETAGSNFTDSSAAGKTLTQVNAPGSDGAGARTFVQASTQYGGIADAGGYFSPSAIYFMARIYPTTINSGILTGKRFGSAVEWQAEFIAGDLFNFRMRNAATTSFSLSVAAPAASQWAIVEGGYSTTDSKIYAGVNGTLSEAAGGATIYAGTADFRLGAIVSGVVATFDGSIDAIYFFSAKPQDFERGWLINGGAFRSYADLANSPAGMPNYYQQQQAAAL